MLLELACDTSCEEAHAAVVALDDAKAEYNELAVARAISGQLLAIYSQLLVDENIEKQVYWNGQLVGPHL